MNKKMIRLATLAAAMLALNACTPYASLDINAPFKVGPVYVNPSIGIGGTL
ncbi:hypothetical protein [Pseudoalteromonas gelatinilytica]|uniref:Lipoprotein n=1 Tax=Pseudoalteromonas gelatinilytica TaxID=1703256 RepID=A0ABQ1T1Z1_9GAMM|nr:hypothetical protein [Pseudoalteromonas profundi]GGE80106.1 hypothetical protein GCM10008027_00990 [Pseudoalteromonas profundi]